MNKGHCFITEDGSIFWILHVHNITPYFDVSGQFTRSSEFSIGYTPVSYGCLGIELLDIAQLISYYISSKCFSKCAQTAKQAMWGLRKQ